ncbi:hypothetical protein N9A94_02690 [Akkermansiaceae bacterium]|nr:hypothetical protein [Akkermansiaceae bacterium]MDA7888190.1 hypothetical protein [Akkermansiaceae bacterium]
MDVSKLEPADRDPKKLRATAYKLVLLMVIGGIGLQYAYRNYQERTGKSDRPSMLTKVTDKTRLITSDKVVHDIQDLKGKVTLVLTLTKKIQPESQPSLDALKVVMEKFPEEAKRPHLLLFILDGSEEDPEAMSKILAEYGDETKVWRVAADKDGKVSLRAFMKNRLQFGIYPRLEEGRYVYDSQIVLLDQFLHVRGQPGASHGWDFEKVVGWAKEYEQARIDHPDKELTPVPMTEEGLQNLLIKSIEYLYANPDEKGQK